ncbi:MAG TPA: hypothetical protein DIT64_13870, partial [Verrucomicrobiales bacterium]|nr:hypothetical protein [Verrucomicrobiales bacterium]
MQKPPASPRPRVFLSTVSREFKTLRMEIEKVVRHLGYDPVSMDDWSAAHGELRAWLRAQLESCDGIIHLAGLAYGDEPGEQDPAAHGLPAGTPRYSYTQYEWHYAQAIGLKSWLILPGADCTRDTAPDELDLPVDPAPPGQPPPDPAVHQAARRLWQAEHIARLKAQNHARHEPADDLQLHKLLDTLHDHAAEMRQRFAQWQGFVTEYLARMEGKLDAAAEGVRRVEGQTRGLRKAAALGVAALLVIGAAGWWIRRDTSQTAKGQDEIVQGQARLEEQMRKMRESLGIIQQQSDPLLDPVADWPRERLERALARQMGMPEEELRALLAAGRTSVDELLQGQALLASGQSADAVARFDRVISQEQAATERRSLAYLGKANAAYMQGDRAAALALSGRACALADREENPGLWAELHFNQGFLLWEEGRLAEASKMLQQVLEAREQTEGETSAGTLSACFMLARVLQDQGSEQEAFFLYERVLEDPRRLLPAASHIRFYARYNLAYLLFEAGDAAEAERLARASLASSVEDFGEGSAMHVESLVLLAVILRDKGSLAEARDMADGAAELAQRHLPVGSPVKAETLALRASMLRQFGHHEAAEGIYRSLAETQSALEKDGGPKTAAALADLAQAILDRGGRNEALEMLAKSVAMLVKHHGEDSHVVWTARDNLALALAETGDYSGAEALHQQVLAARTEKYGAEHPATLLSLGNLADAQKQQGSYEKAEKNMRAVYQASLRLYGPDHARTLSSLNNLALLLKEKGDYAAAEPLQRQAYEDSLRVLGRDHPYTLKYLNNLALVLEHKGDYAAAEPLQRQAYEDSLRVLGKDHPDTLNHLNNYAVLLEHKGDLKAAEPFQRQAYEDSLRIHGKDHPLTLSRLNNLGVLPPPNRSSA